MLSKGWALLKQTVLSFIEDEALSKGAAIAFYTVTSIAPILLIVVAIAGLALGRETAQDAITSQLGGLMGQQTADVLQSAISTASAKSSGVWATIIGLITLIVTASGVFQCRFYEDASRRTSRCWSSAWRHLLHRLLAGCEVALLRHAGRLGLRRDDRG